MKITECTPPTHWRGAVRVSTSEFGWDLAQMVGYDPVDDTAKIKHPMHRSTLSIERRWVLFEGCDLVDRAKHFNHVRVVERP